MTRSFKNFFIFLIPILFLGVLACDKDKMTTINGMVVDKVTGLPLQGANIIFSVKSKNAKPSDYPDYPTIVSDENGKFNFSHNDIVNFHDVNLSGYLPKGSGSDIPSISQDMVNDILLTLIPKDGNLKLHLTNSGIQDTIYIGIYSPIQEAEYAPSNGVIFRESFIVEGQNSLNKILHIASEETINIYWGFSPLQFDITTSPFHDNVFVTRGDTTVFNINF